MHLFASSDPVQLADAGQDQPNTNKNMAPNKDENKTEMGKAESWRSALCRR